MYDQHRAGDPPPGSSLFRSFSARGGLTPVGAPLIDADFSDNRGLIHRARCWVDVDRVHRIEDAAEHVHLLEQLRIGDELFLAGAGAQMSIAGKVRLSESLSLRGRDRLKTV